MSRTFKLTLAYDGTDYAGWQVQPGQKTIQGNLQRALRQILGHDVHVIGSGRTDSGVHAIAQVASLSIPSWRHDAESLGRALNAHLPESIVVTEAVDAPEGFHAIRDAVSKRYRYQLQVGGIRDAFDFRYRWYLKGPLNMNAMKSAAKLFMGTHDFASFQATGSDRKTTIREIRGCEVIHQSSDRPGRLHVAIEVEANGFLYNMVRNIAGTIVEVGLGKCSPESIQSMLAARNRDVAGQTAPAHALFLVRVDYKPFTIPGN